MFRSPSPEVLIVGAGAAGLTLAIDLARRNVAARIIDKAPAPFHGSRGKGIQPRTQEVLEDLGVIDKIAALGGFYPPLRLHGPDGYQDVTMMEVRPESPEEPYRQPLMLPQAMTESVLRERLAELGVGVEFGVELIGFREDDGAVEASIASPVGIVETLRVPYLVGADGGASFVRKHLGIGFPGETLPVRAVVVDLTLEGLGREAWHSWNAKDRSQMISFCPLAGTDMFQLQALLPLEGEMDISLGGLAAMTAERTGRNDIRLHAVHWCSAFQPSARLADRYRAGRVFIAGDAGHVHPPTGGQGLNTSIQDAYNLGWKLAAVLRGAPDTLLDSYEPERRPIAATMLAHTTGLARSGEMRRGRENHEMDLGYFDSALTCEARGRIGRLRAGARAPDAPCRGAGGQPVRLFDIFRGPHATLLGYEAPVEAGAAPRRGLHIHHVGGQGDLLDEDGHIRIAYDLDPGDWVLIRPDGHVGAIVGAGEKDVLENQLSAIGLPARPEVFSLLRA